MNSREMLEVENAMRGPLGKWLLESLKTEADETRINASLMIPQTLGEQNEREHLLARANTLQSLITDIPNKIKSELHSLEELENKSK